MNNNIHDIIHVTVVSSLLSTMRCDDCLQEQRIGLQNTGDCHKFILCSCKLENWKTEVERGTCSQCPIAGDATVSIRHFSLIIIFTYCTARF